MRSGLKSHSYQEPNLKETVSREEEWGNLACVRAAWVQLGEGSCPQREIESGYFWACPPVPSLTYNHASSTPFTIFTHPSQSTTAGPSSTVPHQDLSIHGFMFYTDGLETGGGWESQTEPPERIAEENGCIGCCPVISPVCICSQSWSVLRLPLDERWGRELCVMVLACYASPNQTWCNTEEE